MNSSHRFESVDVEWLGHASVKLSTDEYTVYIDPWRDVMEGEHEEADIIISTHDHFDHFDKKMIQELKKRDTVLVCTEESMDDAPEEMETRQIRPNSTVKAKGLRIRGVHAYNVDKFREPDTPFHPEGFSVGVILKMDGIKFYHASDTDPIEEMEDLPEDIDVAFLPVGGHYTMDQEEAIEAINIFEPENVVPIHFGVVENTSADVEKFREDVEERTGSNPVILSS
jgi:L-ascorbate metabolism protein UlaG (beta-lactamase superfamily)